MRADRIGYLGWLRTPARARSGRVPFWILVAVTATGTYKVNPDCTGTYILPGTTLFFVIADSGNEIHAVCIDPGVVLNHTFRRQFPAGDWRQ